MAEQDQNTTTVRKSTKPGYQVQSKNMHMAEIKARIIDVGGEFEVYDLYDADGGKSALNRYVYVDNNLEKPYASLTKDEQDVLNPHVVESEPDIIEK